jgi:hypothetical protein
MDSKPNAMPISTRVKKRPCPLAAGGAGVVVATKSRPKTKGGTLAALTASALALTGIAGPTRADVPIEEAKAAAAFSYYREDNLSPGKLSTSIDSGSRDRFEVFTSQLRFDLPLTERADVGVDFLYEKMSGASPWYVLPDVNSGKPLQVMSGATIEDQRYELSADVDFFIERGKNTGSAGFSKEDDYLSINFGIGRERNYNDRNTTISLAGAFAYDWIDPTDPSFSQARPTSGEKWSLDLLASLSQILSRNSTMSLTVNYKHLDGYLGDPYKAITQFGVISGIDTVLSDLRPNQKDRVSLLARYRHHVEDLAGSLHADYRFYTDDWGVTSHTVDLAWYQNILGWVTITPSVRWYSQGKADFYDTILPIGNIPKHHSSDYRLSPYGAISYKIKAEVELPDLWQFDAPAWLQALGVTDGMDLTASVSYQRYYSDGALSVVTVSESDEAPGLLRFRVFAFSLAGRF